MMSRASTPPDLLALPPRTLASSSSTPGGSMMDGGRQERRGERQEAGRRQPSGEARREAGGKQTADGRRQTPLWSSPRARQEIEVHKGALRALVLALPSFRSHVLLMPSRQQQVTTLVRLLVFTRASRMPPDAASLTDTLATTLFSLMPLSYARPARLDASGQAGRTRRGGGGEGRKGGNKERAGGGGGSRGAPRLDRQARQADAPSSARSAIRGRRAPAAARAAAAHSRRASEGCLRRLPQDDVASYAQD